MRGFSGFRRKKLQQAPDMREAVEETATVSFDACIEG